MPLALSYCANAVKEQAYPYFVATLFVPAERRESCFGFLAFHAEMMRVPNRVSEPMLGYIRFAWWREALAQIRGGKSTRAHPLLEALEPLLQQDIALHPQLEKSLMCCEAVLEPKEAPPLPDHASLAILAGQKGEAKCLRAYAKAEKLFGAGHICGYSGHKRLKAVLSIALA